jgi:hypothetical protein
MVGNVVLDTTYHTKKSPNFLDVFGLCNFEDHFDVLASWSVSCLRVGGTEEFDHRRAEVALLKANLHSGFFEA